MGHLKRKFNTANDVFEYYFDLISKKGVVFDNTKAVFDASFLILNPLRNLITSSFRNWKESYAKREFEWYLSGDSNIRNIAPYAKIWYTHADKKGNVNSNYGFQWNRENQLDLIVSKLKDSNLTRQAWITIYDGKEISSSLACKEEGYKYDTPCTLNVGFNILNGSLNMSVLMRSNDLWYGFCNDQYCFSSLQSIIAERLKVKVGTYYHYAANLHLYDYILLTYHHPNP